jgi:tyrosyl-DNA phosphodiesterase 2
VDKSLLIEQIFRVSYNSKFGRDVIFVDIAVAPALERSLATKAESRLKTLRVGNTHLESLVASPPLCPAQVAASTRHLKASQVHTGILAGDFNAIQDFGRTIHVKNKLKDAYLVLGGLEDNGGWIRYLFAAASELTD